MSNLTLDGSTSFIGTEFIKLLATGSSNLATEEYVDDAIAQGVGNGAIDAYTKTETDNLLNNKLNVNNPQDITGNLRLDPTNGNSKIILNAIAPPNANDAFYCNGNAHINGTMRVSLLTSDGDVNCDGVNANTFNVNLANTKISFNDDTFEYMKYENSNVDANFYGLKVLSNLYTMDVYPQSIKLPYNNKIAFIDTNGATDGDYYNDNYINITIDGGIQRLNQVIMGNGEHRWYIGDINTANDGDLVMKLSNTRIDIYKDLYLNDVLFQQGGGGNSGAFSEDVVIADTFQLKTDKISTNGLNDMVFDVDTVGEFLRFQVSDNTVRVPNTRSFLSQNIYLDNLRPLTFSNDVVLYGGNNTNDAYEEYMRLDASTEKVNFSKNVDMNEDVIMKQTKVLYLDATASLQRYITTRNDNGQDILELVNNKATNNQIRFTNNGSTSLIVDNSFVYSPRQIQGNNGLKVDFIDTRTTTADFEFRRNNEPFLTLDKFTENSVEKEAIICSKQLRANSNMLVNNLQINQITTGLDNYADFRLEDNNSRIRFFVGDPNNVNLQIIKTDTLNEILLNRTTKCNGTFHTNTINSYDDNTLTIQQNSNPFIALQGSTLNRVQVNRFLRVVDGGASTQCHFVESTNGNYMEFRLGSYINAYTSGNPVNGNTLYLNYFSHGNVFLGTNQNTGADPIPTITINKVSSGTGNAFEVQGNSVFSGTVSTNTLDSESGDLVLQRLGTEYIRCQGSDFTIRMNYSVVSTNTYVDNHRPTVFGVDTFFYGNNSTDNGYIEYFRFNHANQRCDYFVNINSNSNITCVGLVETSDKRLKDNIEDVDEDCIEIVKKANIKTYNLKNDDKKKHHIGFIAQEIKEILPEKFEAIVNEDNEFMGINYGKMSAILWKALQETLTKVEHLESSVYELQEELKEYKKPTPKSKAKAKAKSKTKAENK